MDKRKRLNRNAFTEKLIHRYLLERYYFGPAKVRDALLPEKYHKRAINLIAPEEVTKGAGYRPDLTIYFKGKREGVPIEVKWSLNNLNRSNQTKPLKEKNGFAVALDGTKQLDIPTILIDQTDFSTWIAENISRLTRESIASHALKTDISNKQYWLVFLRGTSGANFEKMLKGHTDAPFWAFRQDPKALRNILNIQKGDQCIFIIGNTNAKGQRMSYNSEQTIEYTDWFVTEVKDPNYMILKGPRGTFFEKADIPIGERRWPHFMDFKIIKQRRHAERMSFGKLSLWHRAFSESFNFGGGAPSPLSRPDFEALLDHLHHTSEPSDN